MIFVLISLIVCEILFNWFFKENESNAKQKELIAKGISAAIIACAIVCMFTSAINAFFYVYFSILIVSNALRAIWIWGHKPLVKTVTFYADSLLTIVASCFIWTKVTYVLIAIAFLMVLIMVHEFGHYTAGKLLKFKINEFSIGFGPALFEKTKSNGEKFAVRLIPLGGYCAFDGEDEDKDSDGAFNKQAPWKRLIVLFSGVFFNFLFGLLMSIFYLLIALKPMPQIIAVSDNNANDLKPNDIILSVNDNDVDFYKVSKAPLEQVSNQLAGFEGGEEITLTILRDGKKQDVVVKKEFRTAFRYVLSPEKLVGNAYLEDNGNYIPFESATAVYDYLKSVENEMVSIYHKNDAGEFIAYTEEEVISIAGVSTASEGTTLGILQSYHYEEYTFGEALLYSVPFCLDICWLILLVLAGLFTGTTAVADLGGTVTAVDQIAELTSLDLRYLLYLIPMISMNLAVFNLLPIPALDGARMVFVLIEWIRRKPINRNVEGYIHFIGLLILFSLVIFLDVYHFFIL